jgi:hypothetical protein
MPHSSVKDSENTAIWLIGAPGVGMNTLGAALNGFMLDLIGYRTSHELHREWLLSVECTRYRITDPENRSPYFYGYCNNLGDVAQLPWRMICLLYADPATLMSRVQRYRRSENIRDGVLDSEVCQQILQLQVRMQSEFAHMVKRPTRFVIIPIELGTQGVLDEIRHNLKEGGVHETHF